MNDNKGYFHYRSNNYLAAVGGLWVRKGSQYPQSQLLGVFRQSSETARKHPDVSELCRKAQRSCGFSILYLTFSGKTFCPLT